MYRIDDIDEVRASRSFYADDTRRVAQRLLGCYLARYLSSQWCFAQIVETEAYISQDPACHAYRGKTQANASLFGPVGHAYVYLSYGVHACFNVVAYNAQEHNAGGVLIRATAPINCHAIVKAHRKITNTHHCPVRTTNGPGKLTQAYAIDRSYDAHDLCQSQELTIMAPEAKGRHEIRQTPRVGITKAAEKPWRYYIANHPYVSKGSFLS